MHLFAIFLVVTIAWSVRYKSVLGLGNWTERWHQALFLLLFPALLILTTAIAVLYMGCHGAMLGMKAGSLGCAASASVILVAVVSLSKLTYQGNQSIRQLANCKRQTVEGIPARIIETELLYSAQIGFWQSELVVSRGLLSALDSPHLKAVLAHEQAHLNYRDTFWFFWLGWIRSFTAWLPNTEVLWQELLLLRELRADRQAAESVDFLLLAESLLTVAKSPLESSVVFCANLHDYTSGDRLNERINFLLAETEPIESIILQEWSWLCLLFLPLLTIPLHY